MRILRVNRTGCRRCCLQRLLRFRLLPLILSPLKLFLFCGIYFTLCHIIEQLMLLCIHFLSPC